MLIQRRARRSSSSSDNTRKAMTAFPSLDDTTPSVRLRALDGLQRQIVHALPVALNTEVLDFALSLRVSPSSRVTSGREFTK